MTLATINSVWVGSKLGPIHAACLRSFVRNGHRTVLHVFDAPSDLPEGVELADATSLLNSAAKPWTRKGIQPAVLSDLLRYELLARGHGLYVDCDCYCLRPIENAECIFCWESDGRVNTGVLKLPPDSPVLSALRQLGSVRAFVPPWASARRQLYYHIRAAAGIPVPIHKMPWGDTGPKALTWYIKLYGLDGEAEPIDVFYPVHYDQVPLLLDPGLTIEDLTTHRTRILHLSNSRLAALGGMSRIPPSSPLGTIVES